MEGGFTTREFLEANHETLQTREGVLSVAMMLEGRALDLYSRYAQKVRAPETMETLLGPADQDKGHLVLLGKMLEEPGTI